MSKYKRVKKTDTRVQEPAKRRKVVAIPKLNSGDAERAMALFRGANPMHTRRI